MQKILAIVSERSPPPVFQMKHDNVDINFISFLLLCDLLERSQVLSR